MDTDAPDPAGGTETRRVAVVDAFTDEPLSGNAAGVVPDADGLSTDQMAAMARELAVSETAFLQSSGGADRRVRYFTPSREVDLCGHATIGAHAFLHGDGVLDSGTHSLETNVGVLEVEVEDDGAVWMTQDDPTVRRVEGDYDRIAAALGVDAAALRDVGEDLPLAVASTGLRYLVVPVNFLSTLGAIDPDADAVAALCEDDDAVGLYAFTFDAIDADATLHGRMFAPPLGLPEDPVTGTASGAVGAYLRHVAAFGADMPEEMVFEQGHFVDRPGRVRVRVGERVRVGGRAVLALDGRLAVPDRESDDIIEV